MSNQRFRVKIKENLHWGIVIGAFLVYGGFVWSYRYQPNEILALLGILPVLVAGWFFGIIGGILGTPATYLLVFLILALTGEGRWDTVLSYYKEPIILVSRVIGTFILGAFAGWGSEHLRNLQRELRQREIVANRLLQREANYKDFIESAQDLFCTHDLNGNIIDINRAAVSMLGYSLDLLYLMKLSDLLLPENRHLFKSYIRELKTRGEAKGLMTVKTRSGEKRILAYRSSLQQSENLPPVVRVVARDATEEIKKERAQKAEIIFWEKLSNATRAALEAENLSDMLQILAEKSGELFEAKNCYIAMWDENTQFLVPIAAYGKEREKFLAEGLSKEQKSAAMRALNSGEVVFSESEKPTLEATAQFCFALPLIADNQKLGVVIIEHERACKFNETKLAQVRRAAKQFSMTADKIWLLDKARRRLKELDALHTLSLAIGKIFDEKELLQRATEILGAMLYPDYFDILMVDEKTNHLVFHSAYQESRSSVPSIPIEKGIVGRVVRTGKTALIPDVTKDPDYFSAIPGMRSELCVPITLRGSVIGVINAESHLFNAFTKEDERLLVAASEQLAVALDRIRTETARQEWARRLERSNALIRALTQIAAYMETATDPQKVMRLMGAKLKELGLDTAVLLLDSAYQHFQVRYISFDEEIISRLERVFPCKLEECHIAIDNLAPIFNNTDKEKNHHALVTAKDALEKILQDSSKRLSKYIFEITKLKPEQSVSYFPLLAQEKFMGFLWLWGEGLKEEDLPALSLFANQAAAAIENARLFLEVQRLAVTDELTNINNRRNFFKLAFSEFYRARRYARPLSILMIDIDHFKEVNDQYGHSIGDIVLQAIAQACQSALRDLDIIGRYGGEEFIALLSETTLRDAYVIAERLRNKIRRMKIATPKGTLEVTVSIGIAGDNVEDTNLLEMIECADQAMYAAKRAGRNRVMVAGDAECAAVQEREKNEPFSQI